MCHLHAKFLKMLSLYLSFKSFFEVVNDLNPCLSFLLILLTLKLLTSLSKLATADVFLLDFTCYKPRNGSSQRAMTRIMMVEKSRKYGVHYYSKETVDFMEQILERSGLGDETYFPEAFVEEPPTPTMQKASEESQEVIFQLVEDLVEKTKVKTEDIGILIVNCTLFNVVPSLSAMVVNKFKLRADVRSFNVRGMGCRQAFDALASLEISLRLYIVLRSYYSWCIENMTLQVHKNMLALVVSTENITENCYVGNNLSMIGTNCYFRVGGAAMLLTNRKADQTRVKYQLLHNVDIQTASIDRAYKCISQEEDKDGFRGIHVNKDILVSANEAIQENVKSLGSLVLPVHEIFSFLVNRLKRRCFSWKRIESYVPNFTQQFDHFLPHVGAKVVLDALARTLGFNKTQMEASRMTLYRFGNTSISSIWYEMAYIEAKGRVKKNDRVWQIAMGSGFKYSSIVWRAVRNVGCEKLNPWTEEIEQFPVDQNDLGSYPFHFDKI